MNRLLFGILVAVSVLACGCSSQEGKAKASIAKYLAKKLNDPESYKAGDWGKLTPVSGCPNVKYYLQHDYRAKNGFGGYASADDLFLLRDSLDVFFEISSDQLATIRKTNQYKGKTIDQIIREFADSPKGQ